MYIRLFTPAVRNIKIAGPLWGYYGGLLKNTVADYQLDAIEGKCDGFEKSDFVKNFRIAAGIEEGEQYGLPFCDSDVSKVIEFVSYVIEANGGDRHLEKRIDDLVKIIAEAQTDDGYCITHFINKDINKRWTNLMECHELYTAGHLIEGAVAYFNATGKRNFLDVAIKFADHIDLVFGLEEGKLPGYCGHPEIEAALFKLYRATNAGKYLKLAEYFINQRGTEPYYFGEEWERGDKISFWTGQKTSKPLRENGSGIQSHLPVREQTTAEGHAVRALYLYAGMTDAAAETGDVGLLKTCLKLYNNITQRRQMITGGVGATYDNEAFWNDYFLPNDCYAESCAAIGFMFFAHKLFSIEKDAKYMDDFERTLYNNGLSGISRDGRHYFYVNPLEADPVQWAQDLRKKHLKYSRANWLGCACCPPNIAKLIASLGQYVYSFSDSEIYVSLYAESDADIDLNGNHVKISQRTNYPWDEYIKIILSPEKEEEFTIKLRMPAWCRNPEIKINGVNYYGPTVKGFLNIKRVWTNDNNNIIEIKFPMPVELYSAHPSVSDNINKAAVMRGPVLYCAEEIDNGKELHRLVIDNKTQFETVIDEESQYVKIICGGYRIDAANYNDNLYSMNKPYIYNDSRIVLVPYYTWNNRGEGEMRVWLSKRCTGI